MLEPNETLEILDRDCGLFVVILRHHYPDYNCSFRLDKKTWENDAVYRDRYIHLMRTQINNKIKEDTQC